MSEHLPYEEMDQRFNDLPLPDEKASWQKMKELLDEDDNKKRTPLPFSLRSCLGWTFLAAGLAFGWLFLDPGKWWDEEEPKPSTSTDKAPKQITPYKRTDDRKGNTSKQGVKKDAAEPVPAVNQKDLVYQLPPGTRNNRNTKNLPAAERVTNREVQRQNVQPSFKDRLLTTSLNEPGRRADDNPKAKDTVKAGTINMQDQQPSSPMVIPANDTAGKRTILLHDTAVTPVRDTADQKKKIKRSKKMLLAAGIGVQQQIPIAGQTAVPYSRYGRKGSLSDYIPSVYVQLKKEGKWLIQGEFRYGAAKSVREFSYNRKTEYHPGTGQIVTTTMRLKKTYYHELPLSFNYYLRPNLSVGAGGMYSRFSGAITEREIISLNTQNQSITSSKQIIPIKHFTDSFLYKTQLHVLVQADYHWRRFSFGLRYTKDIQPYIKYTRIDGTVNEEKNQSLQAMLRFRLF